MAGTIDSLTSLTISPARNAAPGKSNSYVVTASRRTLLGDRRFSVENINRVWITDAKLPFMVPPSTEANFGDLLVRWRRPTRPGLTDHYALILDFCRRYFLHACDPEREIQGFVCRLTGKAGKDPDLTDLPEDIVSFVIDFLMDALGLSNHDIDKHERDLVARRSLFWNTLGSNDEERSNLLRQLKLAKVEWISLARKAIGRAL
ncbi:unnamed protein product [Heligmosomoides polygyrus]|uniref:DUF4020 domain-containing protein n=1 Tax=Heligmosomoides polygyrus TaxID=6339 RepID=A0A183F939_HELPZ|nr:unnamed protein product [Heligmosomoides polygyrus]